MTDVERVRAAAEALRPHPWATELLNLRAEVARLRAARDRVGPQRTGQVAE